MTGDELLEAIKTRLGVTGEYHDELLLALASDVKEFILDAGADAEDDSSVGAICRGVADLWNYGSGEGKFSEVFYQRVYQLALKRGGSNGGV